MREVNSSTAPISEELPCLCKGADNTRDSVISISLACLHFIMKIAAFTHQGQPHVGQVSADLLSVTPWDLPLAERELGAQGIIERQVRGDAMPATLSSIALS